MADYRADTEKNDGDKYSKRPLWQRVVLYLLVGSVVYFLVYWYVLRGSANPYNY